MELTFGGGHQGEQMQPCGMCDVSGSHGHRACPGVGVLSVFCVLHIPTRSPDTSEALFLTDMLTALGLLGGGFVRITYDHTWEKSRPRSCPALTEVSSLIHEFTEHTACRL